MTDKDANKTTLVKLGQILIEEGDQGTEMFYLNDGLLGVFRNESDEKEVKEGEIIVLCWRKKERQTNGRRWICVVEKRQTNKERETNEADSTCCPRLCFVNTYNTFVYHFEHNRNREGKGRSKGKTSTVYIAFFS